MIKLPVQFLFKIDDMELNQSMKYFVSMLKFWNTLDIIVINIILSLHKNVNIALWIKLNQNATRSMFNPSFIVCSCKMCIYVKQPNTHDVRFKMHWTINIEFMMYRSRKNLNHLMLVVTPVTLLAKQIHIYRISIS